MPWGPARFSNLTFPTSLWVGQTAQTAHSFIESINPSRSSWRVAWRRSDGLKNWVTHSPVFWWWLWPPNFHKHNHHGKPIDFAWQFNAPATSAEMVQLKPTSLRLMPVVCELLKSCAPNKMFHKKLGSCDICEPITTTSTTSYSLWPSNPATPSLL